MYKGESRFFLNWQISKEFSSKLYKATSDYEREGIIYNWISEIGLESTYQLDIN